MTDLADTPTLPGGTRIRRALSSMPYAAHLPKALPSPRPERGLDFEETMTLDDVAGVLEALRDRLVDVAARDRKNEEELSTLRHERACARRFFGLEA